MKLKIAQVIGLNSDQKAALVISESHDTENTFIAVLELVSDDAFTKGRQILSELSDFYFDFDGSTADKLNATFENALKKFDSGTSFDLAIGSISGKILYLIGQGNVEAYLKRSDKLSSLISLGSQKQLISGFLQPGDRLFLATKSLTDFLANELSASLDIDLDVFEEDISNRLGAANLEDQGLAGLLAEVEQPEELNAAMPDKLISLNEEKTANSNRKTISININFLPKLARLVTGFTKFLPKRKPQEEYVSYEQPKPFLSRIIPKGGKARLVLAIILILVIGVGVGLKIKAGKDKAKLALFTQQLQQAKDDFSAAKDLKDLNPTDAKAKLDSAKSEVDKALQLNPKNSDALDLKKQIGENADTILQQFSATSLPVFLDLDLIKKNFRADKMTLSVGNLLMLDTAVKTLVVMDVAKKNQNIIAGSDQLGDAQVASINGGFAFTFSPDKGVIRTDITNQQQVTVAKKDSAWGKIVDLAGFGSNVYLLDADKNQIWKYQPTTGSYSDKKTYLSSGVKADFTDAIRMQIESSVYILKSTGEMLRFTKGNSDNFAYSGLPSGVKNPKSFFVSSDTDNLYLLDSGNSRLLVLTKTGTYKAQYQGDRFATATDLVVDEVGKKVYLLDDGKIYSVDLK